jgi:hypothetical protein
MAEWTVLKAEGPDYSIDRPVDWITGSVSEVKEQIKKKVRNLQDGRKKREEYFNGGEWMFD